MMYQEFETLDWIILMTWNQIIECATDYISGERRVDGEETSINSRLLQTSPVFLWMEYPSGIWVSARELLEKPSTWMSGRL